MIAALESHNGRGAEASLFTIGHTAIDARLGGGLAHGRLHEVFAAESADAVSAAGYALMLAHRAAPGAPLLWVRQDGAARRGERIDGAGLAELGVDPGRFLFASVSDIAALLRAADAILRCHQVGAVIIEAWGRAPALNLTTSRRLSLAAERSGVTALLLRADATPTPSAAQSRWEVKSLPSSPLQADAPGGPAIEIGLLRHRAGLAEQRWRVEWDRDRLCFREPGIREPDFRPPPVSGAVVPLPAGGPVDAVWRRTG